MQCTAKLISILVLMVLSMSGEAQDPWRPAATPLSTRWAKDVNPLAPHPEYPRPQMVRKEWMNLNGLWNYAISPSSTTMMPGSQGQILVPFGIESSLSGVGKRVRADDLLWYSRSVQVPNGWAGRRVLMHFGAVDWRCEVFVNGKAVGTHEGGFDPFSFDITDALAKSGSQDVVVKVWDSTGEGQARGKQISNPHGIFYTPVTGIWQTVWLEPVPEARVDSIRLTPNAKAGAIAVATTTIGKADQVRLTVLDKGKSVASDTFPASSTAELKIPKPELWSPDSPHLYDLKVELIRAGAVVDSINSYFALRDVRIGPDTAGITRIFLNDNPILMAGPLDQGYWPDGLLTAPTFEAMKYDLVVTKRLGFNTVRKHVKVEPATWYRLCDEMGLLVWQDMPSAWHGKDGPSEAVAAQFELEWKRIMDALYHFPSLVMWVPFNEGWGQYDTVRVTDWTMKYDPSRLVNSASGWTDFGAGHVNDIHAYPGPEVPPREVKRAAVLGEFGGLGFPMPGHLWKDDGNWGYVSYKTSAELTDAAVDLLRRTHFLLGDRGLCAIIYTQTTDVEIEVNGFMTYDRAKFKFDEPRLTAAIRALYSPPPLLRILAPTAREAEVKWSYTTDRPVAEWFKPTFDRKEWKVAAGGFGTPETPATTVRTRWDTSDLWIARAFEIPSGKLHDPQLSIYHDEDAEVYLDGNLIATLKGYSGAYRMIPISPTLLSPGRHTIAIHVRQTTGGQYIDAGFTDIVPVK